MIFNEVTAKQFKTLWDKVKGLLDGTTKVGAAGNAEKLGGKGASEYALAEELTKRPLNFKSLSSATEANSYINDYSANLKDDTAYEFEVNITFSNYALTTGVWHINGTRINSLYEIQTAKNYSGSATDRVITVNRAKVNGTWSTWVENATLADLANYLSLSGTAKSAKGVVSHEHNSVDCTNMTVPQLKALLETWANSDAVNCNDFNVYTTRVGQGFINIWNSGDTASVCGWGGWWYWYKLGADRTSDNTRFLVSGYGSTEIYYVTVNRGSWSKITPLLHTGNSTAVKIQESAPTDTSALWVW